MRPLYTVLSCDCDHDRRRFNRALGEHEVSWDGYLHLGKVFDHVRNTLHSETGIVPALTLHVRADIFVKAHHGAYDYCFKIYERELSKSFSDIDEVAWHHHQYRLKKNQWCHEFDDENYVRQHIHETFEAIDGYNIHTVHSGANFQNTSSMNAYNDVGIKADCSGMPGMWSRGSYNRYDYRRIKPNRLYVPCRVDYQESDLVGENKIVEVPVTTVRHPLFKYIGFANLVAKRQKMQRELLNSKYSFVQITAHPLMFRSFISRLLNKYQDLEYYSTYFHADELLPDALKERKTRLFYRQEYLIENLRYLIDIAKKHRRRIEFVNFRELLEKCVVLRAVPSTSAKE